MNSSLQAVKVHHFGHKHDPMTPDLLINRELIRSPRKSDLAFAVLGEEACGTVIDNTSWKRSYGGQGWAQEGFALLLTSHAGVL
jgi:hypothetical protein